MLRRFFTRYFQVILVSAIGVGFVAPTFDRSSEAMLVLLGTLVFVSSFRIDATEMREIRVKPVVLFYSGRYIILPVVLWAIATPVAPLLASGILLMTLAPAGVASPGVTTLYRGNTSLSIVLLVVSSILAPFVAPAILRLTLARSIEIDLVGVLTTMLLTVVVPLILHLPIRRVRGATRWFSDNGAAILTPTVSLLVVIAISQQRTYMLQNPGETALFAVVGAGLFLLYFVVGWFAAFRGTLSSKVSFSLSSGVNNAALAMVIALLYFPPQVASFAVACELPWVFGVVAFRAAVGKRLLPSS